MRKLLFCLMTVSLLLGACGSSEMVTPTSEATPITKVTSTPTTKPTAVSIPPTETPRPTQPPTATSTPVPPKDTPGPTATPTTPSVTSSKGLGGVRITIVYDNTAYDSRLKAEWGFAALIEYGGHTLLFDTGGDGPTLLGNMAELGLDPQRIELIVLSHEHGDHTGGLQALLDVGITPPVYVPAAFPAAFKNRVRAQTELVEVTLPLEILPGVYSTGQLGSAIVEQALVVETQEGMVVITGCAHPGIVEMVRQAKEIVEGEVALVVGGFHLGSVSRSTVQGIIADFRQLGVKQVSPTHCTGPNATAMFATEYGDDYVEGGAGRVMVIGPEPSADTPEQTYQPTFEPSACQFEVPSSYEIECGYLVVPEDRSQPDGPTIRIHVAIFKSTSPNPAPDPVVHLYGGPGGSLLDAASFYLGAGGDEILKTRDYILFNQRGTRYAIPSLECPGYLELLWEAARQGLTLQERRDREMEFLLDCHDDLLGQGIDLAAYNNSENAADVNDLRIALGYEQVNLYGVSYGTRLALTVMRDHADGVRSTILDSVLPLRVDRFSEWAVNAAQAFNVLFEGCAADAYCNQTYPDLETTFYRVVDELNANPTPVTLSGGSVTIDGHHFMELTFGALYRTDVIPWIPAMIATAGRGDVYAISSALEEIFTDGISEGMYYSLRCRDEVPFQSYEEARALTAGLPPPIRDHFASPFIFTLCESWESGVANPVENESVVSHIPTLVLAGQYDPITPPAWAEMAAETLSNSYFYEFPGVGHGVIRSTECGLEIGLQFINDPTTEPDASCLDELTGPDFQ